MHSVLFPIALYGMVVWLYYSMGGTIVDSSWVLCNPSLLLVWGFVSWLSLVVTVLVTSNLIQQN